MVVKGLIQMMDYWRVSCDKLSILLKFGCTVKNLLILYSLCAAPQTNGATATIYCYRLYLKKNVDIDDISKAF